MKNVGKGREEEIIEVIWEITFQEHRNELLQRAIEFILADPGAQPNPGEEKSEGIA